MVTATNHFIRLLVSGKSVKKADRTKGGKYLDKKEQIWRQRREREEEREIDSGSVTLYAKAKQMIDLNIYTEPKYTALSTVYGEVVADQQLTPSASASCARRRHGSSLWPPQRCERPSVPATPRRGRECMCVPLGTAMHGLSKYTMKSSTSTLLPTKAHTPIARERGES